VHLPRIRLTVGGLILAVAVFALNCGALRLIYQDVHYMDVGLILRASSSGFAAGVLPLGNVALLGLSYYALRRMRWSRGASRSGPRPIVAGKTYFSLHLLALAYIAWQFMPESIERYLRLFEPVILCISNAWSTVFEPQGSVSPRIVLHCVAHVVLLSGPLVFASWIGQRLATYCATKLPRSRFRAVTCLVSSAFVALALTIAFSPQPFAEEQMFAIDVDVIDRESGRPITSAFVNLTDAFSSLGRWIFDEPLVPSRAFTDQRGRARLTSRFKANGERNAFGCVGFFSPWGRWLEISAAGYRTARIPLPEVIGQFGEIGLPCVGRVALQPGDDLERPCHEIAGHYLEASAGFGSREIEITRDGRFSFRESSCTYDWYEYGTVSRRGAEIELRPVRNLGQQFNAAVQLKYRLVEWGEQVYLSGTDDRDLMEFCRAAVAAFVPVQTSYVVYPGYLRISSGSQARSGVPRLPARVWVKFLLDQLSPRNTDSIARLALETLHELGRDILGSGDR
jgi:hypothetical protein